MTNKFILISDTHCNLDTMMQIIDFELRDGSIDAVLHCGDFGIYDSDNTSQVPTREKHLITKHKNKIQMFSPYLTEKQIFPVPIYTIPGNHEDFSLVDRLVNGTVKVRNMHVFGQGEVIKLFLGECEIMVMGLGKVLPEGLIHKNKPKIIQEEDIARALEAGNDKRIDILLLHEPPMLGFTHRGRCGSSALTELVQLLEPRLVLAGHMHIEYRSQIGSSQIIGLGYGVKGRYATIDANFNITFKSLKHENIEIKTITITEPILLPQPIKKKSTRPSMPVTGREICAHFGVDYQKSGKQPLGEFFKALKSQMATQPKITKEQAFVLAEQFFIKENI
ncbi:hypothetical protein TI04_06470 [Achromatium sp. WMS2]|nr:hypothetical protein TI04_06470 [Achromatium sp. WMS2]